MKKNKAVVYTRGTSWNPGAISGQVDNVDDLLVEMGVNVGDIIFFHDEEVENRIGRPGLDRLLNLLEYEGVKYLVVYSRDRLSRDFNEYAQIVKEYSKE
ncbi:recombinase family protein [Aquibacillus albus]|uniref:DNA invertase Pin-like site-specific DNA recombinase n=1 Tax=Aquibacillus albus TaxID=1168171 RepID=A0ABS2N2R3_9BACI|nr:recombinase family protein [Aquibacillus albus]MBM7572439.1 DNA invertase Pin-like site-specific DNA recombinase [Aquibacillus albus]